MGPRLKLQLIKVEEDLCSGSVPYHKFVKKTPEEILKQQQQKVEEKKTEGSTQKEITFPKSSKIEKRRERKQNWRCASRQR